MKLFYFIFSAYIVLLCSMPCTDAHNDDQYNQTKSEISGNPVNPHEDETCSPFCNCFCCGSIAVMIAVLPKIISSEFSTDKRFQLEMIKVKNVSFSVWQPPKTV